MISLLRDFLTLVVPLVTFEILSRIFKYKRKNWHMTTKLESEKGTLPCNGIL